MSNQSVWPDGVELLSIPVIAVERATGEFHEFSEKMLTGVTGMKHGIDFIYIGPGGSMVKLAGSVLNFEDVVFLLTPAEAVAGDDFDSFGELL